MIWVKATAVVSATTSVMFMTCFWLRHELSNTVASITAVAARKSVCFIAICTRYNTK